MFGQPEYVHTGRPCAEAIKDTELSTQVTWISFYRWAFLESDYISSGFELNTSSELC